MPKPIIIGIDPGTTAAIAFLDAEGEPIEVKSSRRYSKKEIIKQIRKKGTPLIIGTDKSSLPTTIEEVAAKFHCKVNTPDKDLSREKKSELVSEYTHLAGNEHEKDALASALQAYKSYASHLGKIKQRNKDSYEEIVREKFLDLPEETGRQEQEETKAPSRSKSTENYRKQVKRLQEEVEYLKSKLEDKENQIKSLKDKLSRLKEKKGLTDREALLESKINKLKRKKNRLREKLQEFADAYDKGSIKKVDEGQMKRRRITEDPETFQELKEEGKEAYLVNILLENDEELYYEEIDHCESTGNVVKETVNKYQEKRKKS